MTRTVLFFLHMAKIEKDTPLNAVVALGHHHQSKTIYVDAFSDALNRM